VAREEGFKEIAIAFKMIAKVEAEHEKRFRKLLLSIDTEKVFEREEKTKWKCRKCGYVHEGTKALENCPACQHPKAYFEEMAENY
ncbi:MAG: rubrerythrin family protein, partial [Bacteroidales bacterium]|nr:rubrerythrin family protein [Bacteroidales bacterium]